MYKNAAPSAKKSSTDPKFDFATAKRRVAELFAAAQDAVGNVSGQITFSCDARELANIVVAVHKADGVVDDDDKKSIYAQVAFCRVVGALTQREFPNVITQLEKLFKSTCQSAPDGMDEATDKLLAVFRGLVEQSVVDDAFVESAVKLVRDLLSSDRDQTLQPLLLKKYLNLLKVLIQALSQNKRVGAFSLLSASLRLATSLGDYSDSLAMWDLFDECFAEPDDEYASRRDRLVLICASSICAKVGQSNLVDLLASIEPSSPEKHRSLLRLNIAKVLVELFDTELAEAEQAAFPAEGLPRLRQVRGFCDELAKYCLLFQSDSTEMLFVGFRLLLLAADICFPSQDLEMETVFLDKLKALLGNDSLKTFGDEFCLLSSHYHFNVARLCTEQNQEQLARDSFFQAIACLEQGGMPNEKFISRLIECYKRLHRLKIVRGEEQLVCLVKLAQLEEQLLKMQQQKVSQRVVAPLPLAMLHFSKLTAMIANPEAYAAQHAARQQQAVIDPIAASAAHFASVCQRLQEVGSLGIISDDFTPILSFLLLIPRRSSSVSQALAQITFCRAVQLLLQKNVGLSDEILHKSLDFLGEIPSENLDREFFASYLAAVKNCLVSVDYLQFTPNTEGYIFGTLRRLAECFENSQELISTLSDAAVAYVVNQALATDDMCKKLGKVFSESPFISLPLVYEKLFLRLFDMAEGYLVLDLDVACQKWDGILTSVHFAGTQAQSQSVSEKCAQLEPRFSRAGELHAAVQEAINQSVAADELPAALDALIRALLGELAIKQLDDLLSQFFTVFWGHIDNADPISAEEEIGLSAKLILVLQFCDNTKIHLQVPQRLNLIKAHGLLAAWNGHIDVCMIAYKLMLEGLFSGEVLFDKNLEVVWPSFLGLLRVSLSETAIINFYYHLHYNLTSCERLGLISPMCISRLRCDMTDALFDLCEKRFSDDLPAQLRFLIKITNLGCHFLPYAKVLNHFLFCKYYPLEESLIGRSEFNALANESFPGVTLSGDGEMEVAPCQLQLEHLREQQADFDKKVQQLLGVARLSLKSLKSRMSRSFSRWHDHARAQVQARNEEAVRRQAEEEAARQRAKEEKAQRQGDELRRKEEIKKIKKNARKLRTERREKFKAWFKQHFSAELVNQFTSFNFSGIEFFAADFVSITSDVLRAKQVSLQFAEDGSLQVSYPEGKMLEELLGDGEEIKACLHREIQLREAAAARVKLDRQLTGKIRSQPAEPQAAAVEEPQSNPQDLLVKLNGLTAMQELGLAWQLLDNGRDPRLLVTDDALQDLFVRFGLNFAAEVAQQSEIFAAQHGKAIKDFRGIFVKRIVDDLKAQGVTVKQHVATNSVTLTAKFNTFKPNFVLVDFLVVDQVLELFVNVGKQCSDLQQKKQVKEAAQQRQAEEAARQRRAEEVARQRRAEQKKKKTGPAKGSGAARASSTTTTTTTTHGIVRRALKAAAVPKPAVQQEAPASPARSDTSDSSGASSAADTVSTTSTASTGPVDAAGFAIPAWMLSPPTACTQEDEGLTWWPPFGCSS